MKLILIALLALIAGCMTSKIPNYQVTKGGDLIIYRYTKKGQEQRDIFSNGDTLVSTKGSVYIISGKDTIWYVKPEKQ